MLVRGTPPIFSAQTRTGVEFQSCKWGVIRLVRGQNACKMAETRVTPNVWGIVLEVYNVCRIDRSGCL